MPRPKGRAVVSSSSESEIYEEEENCDSNDHNDSFEPAGDILSLYDRLNTYVDATDRSKDMLFKDLKKAPVSMKRAMFSILAEHKGKIAPLLADRAEVVRRLNNCSEKLDTMLQDCLAGADLGPPSPEPGEPEVANDGQYKFQLQAIKIKHTGMLEELEQSRDQAERVINNMVELQIPFRPISKEDHRRMIDTSTSRYSAVEESIKRSTVNAVMVINNKCLDARRRRRNFTKETTEVLTQWFNEHINHPYPTDEEKNVLAYECNISVQQITNWFGNRRVRQKRQADRPLQPPTSPKKKEGLGSGPKNRNHLKGNRGQARTALQQQGSRQLLAVPMQQLQQHQLTLQQQHSMIEQSYQMDRFEPQGMQHAGNLLIQDHYQMGSIDQSMLDDLRSTGSQEMHSMARIIGDKSYTAL